MSNWFLPILALLLGIRSERSRGSNHLKEFDNARWRAICTKLWVTSSSILRREKMGMDRIKWHQDRASSWRFFFDISSFNFSFSRISMFQIRIRPPTMVILWQTHTSVLDSFSRVIWVNDWIRGEDFLTVFLFPSFTWDDWHRKMVDKRTAREKNSMSWYQS